jgi:hypothetical protein
MDLTLITKLKEKLRTETRFDEIWNYFFDHLIDDDEFMSMGRVIKRNDVLEAVLGQLGARLFKTANLVVQIRLVRVEQHQLIHGAGTMNGNIISVLYFEDDQLGIVNVVMPNGRTEMARFSGRLVTQPNYNPSPN